jgi:hypothetical protein
MMWSTDFPFLFPIINDVLKGRQYLVLRCENDVLL